MCVIGILSLRVALSSRLCHGRPVPSILVSVLRLQVPTPGHRQVPRPLVDWHSATRHGMRITTFLFYLLEWATIKRESEERILAPRLQPALYLTLLYGVLLPCIAIVFFHCIGFSYTETVLNVAHRTVAMKLITIDVLHHRTIHWLRFSDGLPWLLPTVLWPLMRLVLLVILYLLLRPGDGEDKALPIAFTESSRVRDGLDAAAVTARTDGSRNGRVRFPASVRLRRYVQKALSAAASYVLEYLCMYRTDSISDSKADSKAHRRKASAVRNEWIHEAAGFTPYTGAQSK